MFGVLIRGRPILVIGLPRANSAPRFPNLYFPGLLAGRGYRRLYPVGTIGVTPSAQKPGTGVLWEYIRQRGSLAFLRGA